VSVCALGSATSDRTLREWPDGCLALNDTRRDVVGVLPVTVRAG
jgi:hypothetical protein